MEPAGAFSVADLLVLILTLPVKPIDLVPGWQRRGEGQAATAAGPDFVHREKTLGWIWIE
jgi:hypothetical protein